MPGTDGQIVFEVTADGRTAMQNIREITRVVEHESQEWDDAAEEATDDIGNSFTGMLKKIGKAFAAAKIGQTLLQIGKEAIEAASDLQEVQNVVDTTFGAQGAQKIEAWAKTAGSQFGLTETQAKRFTSTLGAMMKSSGLAGDEIVGMSTDLAGLAADMASFYNLDFDEAFQKIRSGISGETEPLKQLGINMSVANLEAFALEKGLGKTFAQMTQGEQVMLRYQYMMEATADAQGDFARTSDGYANGMRALETNITSLKTKLGEVLLPAVNDIVGAINGLFGEDAEAKAKRFSILDRINEIQIDKDAKIEEIQLIASEAQALIDVLSKLGQETGAGAAITSLANGANTLDSSSPANWRGILGALRGIDGLDNLFGDGSTATGTVSDLADALSGNSISTSKAQAWDTFLSALSDNADAVSKLTGSSVEETKKWLKGMADTASTLSPEDAESWQTLMNSLVSGISLDTPEGKKFVEQLQTEFLAMGSDSEEAAKGLAFLGYSTDEIQEKQAAWLAVCKDLKNTIPGISELIDDQTGEIKGGLPALREYTEEWEKAQKIQAEMDALRQMQDVYNQENNMGTKKGETMSTRGTFIVRAQNEYGLDEQSAKDLTDFLEAASRAKVDVFDKTANVADIGEEFLPWVGDDERIKATLLNFFKIMTFGKKAKEALQEYYNAVDEMVVTEQELPVVNQMIDEEMQRLADELGVSVEELQNMTEAEVNAAKGMTLLERAASGEAEAIQNVTDIVNNANEALKAMADHAASVHDKIASAIESTTKGFEFIGDAAQRSEKRLKPLNDELKTLEAEGKDISDINKRISDAQDMYGIGNLKKNLDSQLKFLREYKADMEEARARGFSDEFLAQFADGSVESAEWLHELAGASDNQVRELNTLYGQVEQGKRELTDTLTQQQLSIDEVYASLAEKAKQAVAELDLQGEAAENTGKTVEGIATGIRDHVSSVSEQVDAILAQLNRLNGFGINIDFGGFGSITWTTSTGENAEGSHRFGLDYAPHDNYLARLHEGERVLTAQENQIWNTLLNGGVSGFDLESLGGVMRDNIKPGGNVYLDGRAVGTVISDRQGQSYKSLQRSGWQT